MELLLRKHFRVEKLLIRSSRGMNQNIEFLKIVGFNFISSLNVSSPSSLNYNCCYCLSINMIHSLQFLFISWSFNLRLFNFLLFWFWWRLELWSFIDRIHLFVIGFQIAWFCCWQISTCLYITVHLKIPLWPLRNLPLNILLNCFLLRSFSFLFISTHNLLNRLNWCWRCSCAYCRVWSIRILFRNRLKDLYIFLWSSERCFICLDFIEFLFLYTWDLDERRFRWASIHQYLHIFAFFLKILNCLVSIETWFSVLSLFVWSSVWFNILMRGAFSSLFLEILCFLFKHFIQCFQIFFTFLVLLLFFVLSML